MKLENAAFLSWFYRKLRHEVSLMEKLKLSIARRLDKNPKYCWANLIMWALGHRKWYSILSERSNEYDYTSLSCTEKEGAYCGKCRESGRLSK